MIYFISGTPGAGKTLFTIKLLSAETVRPIFYYKIDLTDLGKAALPNWSPLDADGVKAWGSLPDGSIIIIDEAHTIMGQRSPKDKVPQWIEDLAEHRHRGMDFYIIDQHPKDLDIFVRRRVYQHWHYFNVFGLDSSTRLQWSGYQDDQPDDYHAKQRAETTRHSFPTDVYPWYGSATIHTKKKRIPWQLFAIPLLLASVFGVLYSAYYFFLRQDDSPVVDVPLAVGSTDPGATGGASPVLVAPPVPVVMVDSPRQRTIYKDVRNASIPDYVFQAKTVYLVSHYNAFGLTNSLYDIVLDDGSVIPVESDFWASIGGRVAVLGGKCLHRISFPDFELFTRCRPLPSEEDDSKPSTSPPEPPTSSGGASVAEGSSTPSVGL